MEMKKPKSYFEMEEEEVVVGVEWVIFAAVERFVKSWGSRL
jgi:hypothetical protein